MQSLTVGGLNLTYNAEYGVVPKGTERALHNLIKERGYNYVKLGIHSAVLGDPGYVSGWWSPDSYGSYISAN